MKEITRIATVEMTFIKTFDNDEADNLVAHKAEQEQTEAEYMKKHFNADDVHVKIQDFVRDLDEWRDAVQSV